MRTLKGQLNSSFARTSRTGSALILVVVLTVLLSVVGVMFMMVSRIGEMSASSMGDTMALDTGVDIIVSRIEEVLVDDIVIYDAFNNVNRVLDGNGDRFGSNNEYWDYPGPDDPWLASLEPIYDVANNIYIWPHVTDLYDNNYRLGFAVDTYYDPDDDSDNSQYGDPVFEVSAYDVPARILYPDESVSVFEKLLDGTYVEVSTGGRADADGDGVADSRWFAVPHVTGSNGEDLYAAVRIIDNSAMININTAYRDPTIVGHKWDGSQLSHVRMYDNYIGGVVTSLISKSDHDDGFDFTQIQSLRYGNALLADAIDPYSYLNDIKYETGVSIRLQNPDPILFDPLQYYLPFDLSDELDLRNRFFLSSPVDTRCSLAWPVTFKPGDNGVGKTQPYYPDENIVNWYDKLKPDIDHGGTGIGDYNRRFLSTTLNLDRTIAPWVDINSFPNVMPGDLEKAWNKWNNWNDPDQDNWTYRPVCVNDVYSSDPNTIEQLAAAIWLGLPANITTAMPQFTGIAQARERAAYMMAVNLVDYIDADSVVTSHTVGTTTYYGHESTADQLYITKIAVAQYDDGAGDVDTNYAIEVYNPSDNPTNLSSTWDLQKNGTTIIGGLPVNAIGARTSVVVTNDNTLEYGFPGAGSIVTPADYTFAGDDVIELVNNSTGAVFDRVTVPTGVVPSHGPASTNVEIFSAGRDNALGATDYRLAIGTPKATMPILSGTLIWGSAIAALPDYATTATDISNPPIQLEVPDAKLNTIGEFTNVLAVGMMAVKDGSGNITAHYNMPEFFNQIKTQTNGLDVPAVAPNLAAGRIDLMNPDFANIFKYLTVFNPAGDGIDNDGNGISDLDPATDGIDNDGDGFIDAADPELNEIFANFGEYTELAVAGRININTAPWFVIAQFPWMQHSLTLNWYDRARAIYYDRDTNGAFTNIADIMRVTDVRSLGTDTNANSDITGPDFISDTFTDDLEERDLIFQRISNLVTVRSDLFTAYILVRLDVNGPQKRMIAIFDRSKVFSPTDRPRLIALHPVPDPR
ncbi:MAG: hypothetical protein KAJ07_08005 [Planctomycetes bacterium]|nr:hypothetical protein [Planctomycetota bacterium]